MFSSRFTMLLLLFLAIPFFLRFKYSLLEPYPAVLMPVGAFKIKQTSNQLTIKYTSLYGINKKGEWQKIDPNYFLKPIPSQYLKALLINDFNFTNSPRNDLRNKGKLFKLLGKLHLLDERKKETDMPELKNWLRKKLQEQGLMDSVFKEVVTAETVSLLTNTTIAKKDIYDKTFPLGE